MKIKTEGIQYAGSKLKMLPFIQEVMPNDVSRVLDGFSGTTRVSQLFSQLGYDTTANDTSVWSETFGICYLLANKPLKYYQEMIDHLNNLKGYEGWFSHNYGGKSDIAKRPFQLKNTKKLDAIRDEIEKLNLSVEDKSVMLTSLILALDTVDNTIGHYASYLSKWSKRSYNDLNLILPQKFEIKTKNKVIKSDIFDVVQKNEYDLAYFDPPYGSNNDKMPSSRVRYNAYYHFLKTVILNDKPPLFGKNARRLDSKDSYNKNPFENYHPNVAANALEKLLHITKAPYIMLSYSSSGRITKEQLIDILSSEGQILKSISCDFKHNNMANLTSTKEWVNADTGHQEYLFLLKKTI